MHVLFTLFAVCDIFRVISPALVKKTSMNGQLSPFTSSSKLDANFKFSTRNDRSPAHVNQLGDSSAAFPSINSLSNSLSKFEVAAVPDILPRERFSALFVLKTALLAVVLIN